MGKGKSRFALLVGAAAGAAAGYWLNSTKGKLWRKKMKEDTEGFRGTMNDVTQDVSEMAKEKASEFSAQAKGFAKQAKSSFAEAGEELTREAKKAEAFVNKKASDLAQSNQTGVSPKDAIKEGLKKAKETLSSLNGELSKS